MHYSEYTGEWNMEGKSYDRGNIKVYNTYGTSRINGYKIIEETLNLRDVRIFDYVEDENGNKKPVLNKKETAIAQGKQQLIKDAFADWIWKDQERRDRLCKLYIPSRATQAILAEPKHTLSEALLSTDTVFRHIKKRWLLD